MLIWFCVKLQIEFPDTVDFPDFFGSRTEVSKIGLTEIVKKLKKETGAEYKPGFGSRVG